MLNVKNRPATILFVALAALFAVAGVLYIADAAAHLPRFLPGHVAHSARHHYKHAIAAFMLVVAAFGSALLTTSPKQPVVRWLGVHDPR